METSQPTAPTLGPAFSGPALTRSVNDSNMVVLSVELPSLAPGAPTATWRFASQHELHLDRLEVSLSEGSSTLCRQRPR